MFVFAIEEDSQESSSLRRFSEEGGGMVGGVRRTMKL